MPLSFFSWRTTLEMTQRKYLWRGHILEAYVVFFVSMVEGSKDEELSCQDVRLNE